VIGLLLINRLELLISPRRSPADSLENRFNHLFAQADVFLVGEGVPQELGDLPLLPCG
jgi:hypothetical protein